MHAMGCWGFRFTLPQPRNQFSASGSGGHEAQPEMGDGTTPTLSMRSLQSPPRAWCLPDPSPPSVEKFLHAQWGLRSAASTGVARPCLPTQPFPGSSAAPHCALSEALVRLRGQAWPRLPPPTLPCGTYSWSPLPTLPCGTGGGQPHSIVLRRELGFAGMKTQSLPLASPLAYGLTSGN